MQSDVCFATNEHYVKDFYSYEMPISSSCESLKINELSLNVYFLMGLGYFKEMSRSRLWEGLGYV